MEATRALERRNLQQPYHRRMPTKGDSGTGTAQKDRRNGNTRAEREGVEHRERRSRSQSQAHNTVPDPSMDATPGRAMSPGPNARLRTSHAPEE
jgi:hypothetical protein